MFVLSPLAFPQATPATSSPSKDHVLFVGTDLSVKEGSKFYHVVGATKKTLKIDKDRKLTDVRLSGGANIRINKGVKLSNLSATIGNVQTESYDRESARAQLAAMQTAMALTEEASMAADRKHGLMMVLSAVAIPTGAGSGAPQGSDISATSLKAMQDAAAADYIGALPDLDRLTSASSTLLSQNVMQPELRDDEMTLDASALPGLNLLGGSALSDSGTGTSASTSLSRSTVVPGSTEVELRFEVSSPTPLEKPYIVVVANYGSLSKPNEVARQISAREFPHIDSRPVKVKMSHAASLNGLPFRKFDIALFANDQEVATNLSEKRMALTREQAFQFFLIDYLSAHKGATLPPTAVLMTPRAEFRRQVDKTDTDYTLHAKVDKMGNVLEMSADPEKNQNLPASVESALKHVRFMPALEKGTPIDGQLKIRIADLMR
jgi:hypothetical protein